MDRRIRFAVVFLVLAGILAAVLWLLIRELDRIQAESEGRFEFVNATYEAKVGDWVEFRTRTGGLERRTVVASGPWAGKTVSTTADHLLLEVKRQSREPGTWLPPSYSFYPRLCCGLGTKFVLHRIVREDIEVAGRKWRSWRVEGHYSALARVTAWVTDEYPLGLLRIRTDLRAAGTEGGEYNYVYLRHGHEDR